MSAQSICAFPAFATLSANPWPRMHALVEHEAFWDLFDVFPDSVHIPVALFDKLYKFLEMRKQILHHGA